jgi:hypothetical protein
MFAGTGGRTGTRTSSPRSVSAVGWNFNADNRTDFSVTTPYSRANCSVAPDGRFLMNVDAEKPVTTPITIVLNWFVELKAR